MTFTQVHRQFEVTSPLGQDVLLLERMFGSERLSGLFEFTLDLLSSNPGISADDILGKPLTVRAELPDGSSRYFNGFAVRFSHTGGHLDVSSYRVVLRPWLWFLTRTADCLIFQGESAPDIIMSVFRNAGFSDFSNLLTKTYQKRDYCVQYRETSFNFVSRLMEAEGIYYYFKHDDSKHTLVLADGLSAHSTNPGYETVRYYPPDDMGRRETDGLSDWSASWDVRSGKFTHTDYDFKKPRTRMAAVSAATQPYGHGDGEIYDFPGDYLQPDDGEALARVRLEELQAQYELFEGHGEVGGLGAGSLFTLNEHPVDNYNREYLISASNYTAAATPYTMGAQVSPTFSCSLSAIDSTQPFRPHRVTPKPVVCGPQTALVVGKSGDEITTDEYGSVKVQFHWDRKGAKNETSSCWLRVSQLWAGKAWGAMFVPRIGQEVIVDFLEGDPDRPIVTGRVYNGDNKPPYSLPARQTVSTIVSNSSKGGSGSNELRFEDAKGNEEVYMHAQKDFSRVVENNDSLRVGRDLTINIGHDRTVSVETGSDSLTIDNGNYTINVNKGRIAIKAAQSIELTVGASTINLEPKQITLSSPLIKIN
jgi:type VI secretion system secreted protein VgrG